MQRKLNTTFISNKLRRIDALVERCIAKLRRSSPVIADELRGLVIGENEIDELLKNGENPDTDISHEEEFIRAYDSPFTNCEESNRIDGDFDPVITYNSKIEHLQLLFNLSSLEIDILLICLAPECDKKYEKLYAYINDDVTKKRPTVGLIFELLDLSFADQIVIRKLLGAESALIKNRLLYIMNTFQNDTLPFFSRQIKVDNRIVNFLLGVEGMDEHLPYGAVSILETDNELSATDIHYEYPRIQKFLKQYTAKSGHRFVAGFTGPEGSGKRSLAGMLCRDLGKILLQVDARLLSATSIPFEDVLAVLLRECVLCEGAICIGNAEEILFDPYKKRILSNYLSDKIRIIPQLIFLITEKSASFYSLIHCDSVFYGELAFPLPDEGKRNELWKKLANTTIGEFDADDCLALASKFRFTPGQILAAITAAQQSAIWRSPENGNVNATDLYAACRGLSNSQLASLSRKIEPKYCWTDMVLPDDTIEGLHDFCSHAKYRSVVYGKWGFGRKLSLGKGLNALFFGPPGTGKTMAAEVIANDLQLDLFKIDLSQVVSKYIGETEKNLDRIFTEAQMSNAILFFDEADALFGKRTEVKDAHDRYANIETGYLLQKMEEHEGIVILATNVRQNMDDAFTRRIQFIIDFPFPDEQLRVRLWQGMFPSQAALDNNIDWGFMASKVKIAGGNIKNIAINAAFFAAQQAEAISMKHLIVATKNEYKKMGMSFLKPDFIPYFEFTEKKKYDSCNNFPSGVNGTGNHERILVV